MANNPEGDDEFRRDRAVWYEHVTGESLEGLCLTEQWERVDVIARRFREYSDGRSARERERTYRLTEKLYVVNLNAFMLCENQVVRG